MDSIYHGQLIDVLKPQNRLPSYSTVGRSLLHIDLSDIPRAWLCSLQPACGETIGLDGKVFKGSYQIKNDNPNSDSHQQLCWSLLIYC